MEDAQATTTALPTTESQAAPNEGFLRKFKLPIILCILVGSILSCLGIAWLAGAFSSEAASEEEHQEQEPLKIASIALAAGQTIDDLTEVQIKDILATTDASVVPQEKKSMWEDVNARLEYVKGLTAEKALSVEECGKIQKAQASKAKYPLTAEQKTVLDTLFNKCQTAGHIKKPDQTNSIQTNGNENADNNTGNGNGANNDPPKPDEYARMKAFLTNPNPTLSRVLNGATQGHSELIAQFGNLNKLDKEGRIAKLGSEQLNDAFSGLLDKHIETSRSANTAEDLDQATRDVLLIAQNNADVAQLHLTEDQKSAIKRAVELAPKTPAAIAQGLVEQILTTGNAPDLATIAPEVHQGIKNGLLAKIKEVSERTKNENERVKVEDFIALLGHQKAALTLFPGVKLDDAHIAGLEAGRTVRISKCQKAALDVVKLNGDKIANYRNIYEVYNKAGDANKKITGEELIDIVCSKAIIEQAKLATATFVDDSYQSVCLALGAHIHLRGQLKEDGVKCKSEELEKSTTFSFSSFSFNNWAEDDMKAFVAAIDTVHKKMLTSLTNGFITKVSDLTAYSSFITTTQAFVSILTLFYSGRNVNDYHLQQLERARQMLDLWKADCDARSPLMNNAHEAVPEPKENFVKAVMGNKLSPVVASLPVVDTPAQITAFKAIIEDLQKVAVAGIADAASNEHKSKTKPFDAIRAYLDVKSKLTTDGVKTAFNALTASFDNTRYLFSVQLTNSDELVKALEVIQTTELQQAIKELGVKLTEQYDHYESVNANNPTNSEAKHVARVESATLLVDAVKRVALFKALSTTFEDYKSKMVSVADKAFELLNLTNPADKSYCEQHYYQKPVNGTGNLIPKSSSQLLPFLALDSISEEAKKSFVRLYALFVAFNKPQDINMAVPAEADATANFTAGCVEYAKARFTVDFILQSRGANGRIGCSNIKTEKWTHNTISFTPLKSLVEPVETEMTKYASNNCPPVFGDLEEKADSSFPLYKSSEIMRNKKDEFATLRTKLVDAVVKTEFKKPATA